VIAAAIPNAMLLPTDECFAHEVPEPVYDGLTCPKYYIRDVLQPVVVHHFDNHPLATRPVYMDDNPRPHHSKAVTAYLQSRDCNAASN
jgi:hypothetical protein